MGSGFVPTREGDFVPRTEADKNPKRYEPGEVVAPGIRRRSGRVEKPSITNEGSGGRDSFSDGIRKLRTAVPGEGGAKSPGDLRREVEERFAALKKPKEESEV